MSESHVSSSSEMRRRKRRAAREIPAHDASGDIDRRQLLNALTRLKRGDFTVRLDEAHSGVDPVTASTSLRTASKASSAPSTGGPESP